MTDNIDITLLLLAIDNYDYYSKTQRDILKIFVKTSIKGITRVNTTFIAEQLNVSRTSVYKAIDKFTAEKNISIKKGSNTKQRNIIINSKSMLTIIEFYKVKQSIMNSNPQ